MRIGFVEWPDGLLPHGRRWEVIADQVAIERPDILVTNELPFGKWIAASYEFDPAVAVESVAIHELGMAALAALGVPSIVTSRPIWEQGRLANEAVLLEEGGIRPLHRKQYFPAEPGWHETDWYGTAARSFDRTVVGGVTTGALLCTELMFNEQARAYGRAGAELIAAPRATGLDHRSWHIAGAMAALVSGAYVVSSNRVGQADTGGPIFGGEGYAYAPGGQLLATTSSDRPLVTIEFDAERSTRAKAAYPCYVEMPLGF